MRAPSLALFAALFAVLAPPTGAADLVIVPAEPDHIVLDVLSDTHCPVLCGTPPPRCPFPPCPDSIACCDTFRAIVEHQAARPRPQDFTFINGDVGLNSNSSYYPWMKDRFYMYWDQVAGAKALGPGNHEADSANLGGRGTWWRDPENHYAPMNWWEPLFGCDSTTALPDCRRWYSVHVGAPPRIAFLVVNNSSDTWPGDEVHYVWCATPNDGLNHAASPQRQWLSAEIDALPPTVEVVFVFGHRTYYGVEAFCCRPNILLSGLWSAADPETLRTGAVSFLRELESIRARKPAVKQVFMLSGDQHCFSETAPIRWNERDDELGVVYVTLGISGGWNGRGFGFPNLDLIPPNTLVHAFQDDWGSTRFEITETEVRMSVREAYTDSLLHENVWPLDVPSATLPPPAPDLVSGSEPTIEVWPSPARAGEVVQLRFVPAAERRWERIAEIAIYAVDGRLVREIAPTAWSEGTCVAHWDGRDARQRPVAAGSYFVRVAQAGATVASARVTIAR